MAAKRGLCPKCQTWNPLRDGRLAVHVDLHAIPCPGSNQLPKEVR